MEKMETGREIEKTETKKKTIYEIIGSVLLRKIYIEAENEEKAKEIYKREVKNSQQYGVLGMWRLVHKCLICEKEESCDCSKEMTDEKRDRMLENSFKYDVIKVKEIEIIR